MSKSLTYTRSFTFRYIDFESCLFICLLKYTYRQGLKVGIDQDMVFLFSFVYTHIFSLQVPRYTGANLNRCVPVCHSVGYRSCNTDEGHSEHLRDEM